MGHFAPNSLATVWAAGHPSGLFPALSEYFHLLALNPLSPFPFPGDIWALTDYSCNRKTCSRLLFRTTHLALSLRHETHSLLSQLTSIPSQSGHKAFLQVPNHNAPGLPLCFPTVCNCVALLNTLNSKENHLAVHLQLRPSRMLYASREKTLDKLLMR